MTVYDTLSAYASCLHPNEEMTSTFYMRCKVLAWIKVLALIILTKIRCHDRLSRAPDESKSFQTNRTDFELGGIETQFEDMFYH